MLKKIFIFGAIIIGGKFCFSQNPNQLINAVAIPNGAYIIKAPLSDKTSIPTQLEVINWSKEGVIDNNNKKGWRSSREAAFPMEFIFELSEIFVISKLGFNNECEKFYEGICAKNIKVEFSTLSPDKGFQTVSTVTLQEYAPTKYFEIEPADARWIKVIILSNYGNEYNTELMEMEALGKYKNTDRPTINMTGIWESNWGDVSIKQDNSSIYGCYEYQEGKIPLGGIEGNIISFKWVETKSSGRAVLFANAEGTRLNGIWCFGNNFKEYGFWVFKRKSNIPKLCNVKFEKPPEQLKDSIKSLPNIKPTIASVEMKKELEEKGKIIVYGINFEYNSAEIRKESYSVLSDIAQVLRSTPKLKLRIEGHTDDAGTAEYNLNLSERRAKSVKAYLQIFFEISSDRLTSIGYGEKVPVADNSTELGKAANRRVELHPIE